MHALARDCRYVKEGEPAADTGFVMNPPTNDHTCVTARRWGCHPRCRQLLSISGQNSLRPATPGGAPLGMQPIGRLIRNGSTTIASIMASSRMAFVPKPPATLLVISLCDAPPAVSGQPLQARPVIEVGSSRLQDIQSPPVGVGRPYSAKKSA